jgi:hypothetical protein
MHPSTAGQCRGCGWLAGLRAGAVLGLMAVLMSAGPAAATEPPADPPEPTLAEKLARYPVRLREPLRVGPDLVEVTEARTLRRRYRHWGDWDREVADFKTAGLRAVAAAARAPRTIRVGCVFFDDARLVCPQITGGDGKPLEAAYATPASFRRRMREETCPRYGEFVQAFSGGEVRIEWTFVTVPRLVWTFPGPTDPALGFQPRAIASDFERALEVHADDGIQMWVLCGGPPTPLNPADPSQRVDGPPFGISYTQWKLHQGYSLVVTAPQLPLLVHEFNHRYLDNLQSIEGVQLTMFHGLGMLGYESGDCGYEDLLNTYRSVFQHLIRPAMHRRFTLVEVNHTPREPFRGRAYAWADVADDLWFRLPELGPGELATLTGLASLEIIGDRKERYRLFRVADDDQPRVRSPLVDVGTDADTRVDNLLALATESCAVLATATGHWLVVRPDLADIYVDMGRISGRGGPPLEVWGWLNQGVRPLVVLRAPADLPVPPTELDYVRVLDRPQPGP